VPLLYYVLLQDSRFWRAFGVAAGIVSNDTSGKYEEPLLNLATSFERSVVIDFKYVKYVRLIGGGSFARVYEGRCRHPQLMAQALIAAGTTAKNHKNADDLASALRKTRLSSAIVAIKVFHCMELTGALIQDFLHEAQLLKQLDHPYIVKFNAVCIDPPALAILSELCDESVADRLRQRRERYEVSVQQRQQQQQQQRIIGEYDERHHTGRFKLSSTGAGKPNTYAVDDLSVVGSMQSTTSSSVRATFLDSELGLGAGILTPSSSFHKHHHTAGQHLQQQQQQPSSPGRLTRVHSHTAMRQSLLQAAAALNGSSFDDGDVKQQSSSRAPSGFNMSSGVIASDDADDDDDGDDDNDDSQTEVHSAPVAGIDFLSSSTKGDHTLSAAQRALALKHERQHECGFELAELLDIAQCVSEAMAYIHEKNILHRDLKLSNILFDSKKSLHHHNKRDGSQSSKSSSSTSSVAPADIFSATAAAGGGAAVDASGDGNDYKLAAASSHPVQLRTLVLADDDDDDDDDGVTESKKSLLTRALSSPPESKSGGAAALHQHRHVPATIAKLCDFGCSAESWLVNQDAKSNSSSRDSVVSSSISHDPSDLIIGTLAYLSNEILESNAASPKSDVYAFAICLFEMLTGEWAHEDIETSEEIITQVVHCNHRPQIPAWCDPALAQLIARCWHRKPHKRPSFVEITDCLLSIRKQAAL
jgi:serine/threonine protein kinase